VYFYTKGRGFGLGEGYISGLVHNPHTLMRGFRAVW
jgi:hypothetical protein